MHTFKNLIRTNPDFAEDFLRKVSLQSIYNYDLFISLTQKQMPGRIADALIYLSEIVYESNPFEMTISRQDLADLSGMSKESAIRILKDFKEENLIIFPNPADDLINVFTKNSSNSTITICDSSGRITLTMNLIQSINQLEVSGWKRGVYMINLYNMEGNILDRKKIILQ